jgi:hypothetical protein
MLTGKWVSQAIATAAKLAVADALAAGPRHVEDVAASLEVSSAPLYRLLRALASLGIFREEEGRRFANSELSEALRADSPTAMRDMAIFIGDRPTWDAWGELGFSVKTGKSAFEAVHGRLPFDYMRHDAALAAHFNRAMVAFTLQEIEAVLAAYDFSGLGTLCDVGGGEGALIASVLARHPEASGILYDLPHVAERATAYLGGAGVAKRCRVEAGDFFERVPAGADAYLMKHILHDWSDGDAARILARIAAAAPAGARLIVLDNLIDAGSGPDFCKLLDLEMLVLYDGGRERTAAEYRELFASAGFGATRVIPTGSLLNVIEAVRA